ncbi:MAG: U32 family peptidase, partial [Candidatus Desulfofervidaceae bacterium]|nr:U32 family peptidase [Candidatus Desulfofervidaceae bacterium]
MEILAPAGNFESFFAALENGADAIYVGLKAFSARAYAHNFSLNELSYMVPYAHKQGKKIFVALNSLVKETEFKELIDITLALSQIKPDALIIQDLGVFWLLKQRFPHLRLHASTLMNCHNLIGAQKLAQMGFKRIVLARELTLDEIAFIKNNTSVELEIFVHGALCFTYSGLCLASSYLGGQSSLRGRCRQPCRFLYQWGKKKGYFLSCGDLCALEVIPRLKELGINSVKIEGRMKSAEYVAAVVEAYRLMRDASPKETQAAIDYARSLIEQAGGRQFTTGFFLSPRPKDVLNPELPGAFGVYAGRVLQKEDDKIYFLSEIEIKSGDRLRAQSETLGKGIAWKVKTVEKLDNMTVVNAPGKVEPGYLLFRVFSKILGIGKSDKKLKKRLEQEVSPAAFKLSSAAKKRLWQWIYAQGLALPRRKVKRVTWWIRHEQVDYFLDHTFPPETIPLLALNMQSYPQLMHHVKRLLRKHPQITLSLPPVILPTQLSFFAKAVPQLIQLGFKRWHLSNISHFSLLPQRKDLILSADYTFNIANHLSLRTLKELGIRFLTLSIELDRQTIKNIVKHWPAQDLILMVYARIPLFTSRLSLKPFWQNAPLVSPLGEQYYPLTRNEITYILPDEPISLGGYMEELKS